MYLLEFDGTKHTYNNYRKAIEFYQKYFNQYVHVSLFKNSNGCWIKLK